MYTSVRMASRQEEGEEEEKTAKEGAKREKRRERGGTGWGRERGRLKCERRASDDGVIRVGST